MKGVDCVSSFIALRIRDVKLDFFVVMKVTDAYNCINAKALKRPEGIRKTPVLSHRGFRKASKIT